MSTVVEPKKDETNGSAGSAELPVKVESQGATSAGFDSAGGLALLQRGAQLLASSTLVPKEYQGNLPNCVIALNMAQRLGADPLMVMQNLYVVHGRPGWSAQFLIATFNQTGHFSKLRFRWEGEPGKDTWGCRAWAVEKATGEELVGSAVTIGLSKREGWYDRKDRSGQMASKWPTMPEQMLMYRSAAFFVRAYTPELAMGLQTAEELHDTLEAEQVRPGVFEVKGSKLDQLTQTLQGTKPEPGPDDTERLLLASVCEQLEARVGDLARIADIKRGFGIDLAETASLDLLVAYREALEGVVGQAVGQ